MKFLNAVIVSGMTTQEVFASVKQDASSAQKITQPVHARENLKM
jgi:hypothetical protein